MFAFIPGRQGGEPWQKSKALGSQRFTLAPKSPQVPSEIWQWDLSGQWRDQGPYSC